MDGMTVRALRDALRARGMATDGVKATLAARLLESAGGSEGGTKRAREGGAARDGDGDGDGDGGDGDGDGDDDDDDGGGVDGDGDGDGGGGEAGRCRNGVVGDALPSLSAVALRPTLRSSFTTVRRVCE